MSQIFNIGFCITSFTIIVLLFKKINRKPIKYAILLLIMWFVRFLAFYLEDNVNLLKLPFLVVFDQILFFLDGVLLYWFVSSYNNEIKIKKQIIHLIPFFLSIIYVSSIYFSYETTHLVEAHFNLIERLYSGNYKISWEPAINMSLMILVNLYFFKKSIELLKKYKLLLLDNYSNITRLEVTWLEKLTKFWFVLFFIPFIFYFFNGISSIIPMSYIEKLSETGMVLISIFFSVNILLQKYPKQILLEKVDFNKKATDTIDTVENKALFQKICDFMEAEKPYLDANLTLEGLSQLLQLKTVELSKIINTQNNTNFHEFVNAYRIEDIKKGLQESDEQIIIIAYQFGFNSKSTFNSVFKKATGITPSQYRKRHRTHS